MHDFFNLKNTISLSDAEIAEFNKLFLHEPDAAIWRGGGNTPYNPYAPWHSMAHQCRVQWGQYRGFFLNTKVDPNHTYKILDLGCGYGYCTKNLASIFPNSQILALDINSEKLNFCETYNGSERIFYSAHDMCTIEESSNQFDFIFVVESLECAPYSYHISTIQNLLGSLNENNENSRLFISTYKWSDDKPTTECELYQRDRQGFLESKDVAILEYVFRKNIEHFRYYDYSQITNLDPVSYVNYNAMNKENKWHQIILSKQHTNHVKIEQ